MNTRETKNNEKTSLSAKLKRFTQKIGRKVWIEGFREERPLNSTWATARHHAAAASIEERDTKTVTGNGNTLWYHYYNFVNPNQIYYYNQIEALNKLDPNFVQD